MTNKEKSVKFYYLILLLAVVTQAVFTVVRLGQTVCYQHYIHQFQTQKNQLIKKNSQLDQQIGSELSLVATKHQLQEDYTSINQPILITADAKVALR
ncbi:MAG: hypothetical protein U9O78_00845 [Patescibacteria group bacterium]|nr:hypothetical protein [Patescibacteria group bacterium]